MPNLDSVVIIGAGHAGMQAAESLRKLGHAGRLVIIDQASHTPYQRPPLSKDFLDGNNQAPAALPLRGPQQLAGLNLDLRRNTQAVSIDPSQHNVHLSDGTLISYSRLLLATGAANRRLSVPGTQATGVYGLHTLDDALALHGALRQAQRAVVIGAGFIGLEFAAGARKLGLDITVLEHATRPMSRAVTPTISAFFAQAHTSQGTRLHCGTGAVALETTDAGRVAAVLDTHGQRHPADLVVAGIGVQPRDELAAAAGLATDNGIVVNRQLRTSDPDIFAIGDCASFPDPRRNCRTRLESVQNATDQARHAARVILGDHSDYQELPWFWSTQGDLRLQIAGIAQADDETILRGDPGSGRFSNFCFRQGRLVAVESVNQPADHMAARKLLGQGATLTPEQASDLRFDLKTQQYAVAATALMPL